MKNLFFSILFVLILSSTAFAQEKRVKHGDWDVLIVEDPFEDTKRGIASLQMGKDILVVKCDSPGPGSVYVTVYFDGYLGEGRTPVRDVKLRHDSEDAYDDKWYHNKSYAALFDGDRAANFVKKLMITNKLAIQAYSYDFDREVAIFEWSSGADEAIRTVASTCESGLFE